MTAELRDRSEFQSDQSYQNHLEGERNAAQMRGDQKTVDKATDLLKKLQTPAGAEKQQKPKPAAASHAKKETR